MTPTEFIEKYHDNPEITIAFGDNYIVAYRKKDYSEVEKIDFPHAGAIAMRLLYEMIAPNKACNGFGVGSSVSSPVGGCTPNR